LNRFKLVLCLLSSIPAARATVLYTDTTYSSGVLQYDSSNLILVADDQLNPNNPVSYQYTGGFSFTLPTGQDYSSLGFDVALQYGGGSTQVEIWSGDSPSTSLGSVTVSPSSSLSVVSGSFSPTLTLTGGTTYYLMIVTASSGVEWAAATGDPTGTEEEYFDFECCGGSWQPISGITLGAFDITTDTSPVPEPTTVGQMLAGLALVFLIRRRIVTV
jgi:hypothetical protein